MARGACSGVPQQLWPRLLIVVVAAPECVHPAWAMWTGSEWQAVEEGQILGATSAGMEWIGVGNAYCSKKGKSVPIHEDSMQGFGMSGQQCRASCTNIPECKLYTYGIWKEGLPPLGGWGGHRGMMRCELYVTCDVMKYSDMTIWQKPVSSVVMFSEMMEAEDELSSVVIAWLASPLVQIPLAMVCGAGIVLVGYRLMGTSTTGKTPQRARDEDVVLARPVKMVEYDDGKPKVVIDLRKHRKSTSSVARTPSQSSRSRRLPSRSIASEMESDEDTIAERLCRSEDLSRVAVPSEVASPSAFKGKLDEEEEEEEDGHARAG